VIAEIKAGHVVLLLNRFDLPLRLEAGTRVLYDDYLERALLFRRDPASIKGVWWEGRPCYMYFDNPFSRERYLERFEAALKHASRPLRDEEIRLVRERRARPEE